MYKGLCQLQPSNYKQLTQLNMGPLHKTGLEPTKDVDDINEEIVCDPENSTSSAMTETNQSVSARLQNGIVLQIPSEDVEKRNSVPLTTDTVGRPNYGFVHENQTCNTNFTQEMKESICGESVVLKNQEANLDDLQYVNTQGLSENNRGIPDSVPANDEGNKTGTSTPDTHRSRASSKVSFSDINTVSSFKRMDSVTEDETSFCKKIIPLRWQVALMCCLIASLNITIRQCMSMAIVCISDKIVAVSANASQENTSTFADISKHQIQWDSETEGLILSSYYYTFPLTPLLGGYLAGKFGGKYVIFVQMFFMCAASIATPFLAYFDPIYVIVARTIVGFTAGGLMPAIVQLLSKWSPRLERSRMFSIVNSGQSIGNILTFLVSGFICEIPLQGGWPFIFYIFTGFNFMATIIWLFVVYDSPEVHPKATVKEVTYIIQERRSSTAKMPSPPWTKFITSTPFWAILIAHTTHGFIFTVIGTFLPIYMKDVLMYDTKSKIVFIKGTMAFFHFSMGHGVVQNGVLSSLPFIGRFLGSFSVGIIADKCLERKFFSTGTMRKLLQCIGMLGSAPFLIALSYMTEEKKTLAVVLLVCYWTMQSATNAAFRVNHLDIAPLFAGVINGITLTCASIAALAAPVVTAVITVNGTREEWQIVFFICAGLGVFSAFVFSVLGSGEEQKWAKDPNFDIDVNIHSIDVESSNENFNGTSATFTLGGNRRKSLVSLSSDTTINPQENDKNDFASLGKEQMPFENESAIRGICTDNNIKPLGCKMNGFYSENQRNLKTASPSSPTFSFASYGFENATLDIGNESNVHHDDKTSHTMMGIEETVEAQPDLHLNGIYSQTKAYDVTSDTSISQVDVTKTVKNKNSKYLSIFLGNNDTVSESTHL